MPSIVRRAVGAARRRKGLLHAALGLLGFALIAGPAHANDLAAVGSTGKPEKTHILFALSPTAEEAVFALALKKGYFKDEGLDVTWKPRSGATAIVDLISGDSDMTTVTWLQFLLVAQQGVALKAVTETSRSGPGIAEYVVKPSSPIRDIKDLVGKKLGVITKNGVCDFILDDKMKSVGLDYSTVKYVNIPIPDMLPTLLSGGIDGVCLTEPLLSPALKKGTVRAVVDLTAGAHADWPISADVVSAAFAAKYPNTVGALRRALLKAAKLAADNPDQVRAVIPTYSKVSPELAKEIRLPTYHADSDIAGAAKRNLDLLQRLGLVK